MHVDEHKWLVEKTSPYTAHMFSVSSFLVNLKTKYQQVEIAESQLYGRVLILDGKIQSAEFDEYIYHEALVHPAMLTSPKPRRVLITGGGEGATLREVFKHPAVETVVMVDLDKEVVDLCRAYLDAWHAGSFEDKRLNLIHMDARKYMEDTDREFDVIISDIPEPVEQGPALKLFTGQYYELVKKRLAKGGIFALQAGDCGLPFIEVHSAINNTLRKNMSFVQSYRAFVPSFNADWGYILASPALLKLPTGAGYDRLITDRNLKLKYFDGETAHAMFSLPKDIRKRLAEETKIIDDDQLLTVY